MASRMQCSDHVFAPFSYPEPPLTGPSPRAAGPTCVRELLCTTCKQFDVSERKPRASGFSRDLTPAPMHRLRHPLLSFWGAALFLFMGAADALGVAACAHHAHSEDGDHGAHASVAVATEAADHAGHHDHEGHHDHPLHGGDVSDDAAESERSSPEPECTCGFLCCGASGTSSMESRDSLAPVGPEPVLTPASGLASGDEGLLPGGPLPHAQPYPLGPPSHS